MNCLVCQEIFESNVALSRHIRYRHHLDAKRYYDQYLRKSREGVCQNPLCPHHGLRETSFIGMTRGYCRFCCNSCAQLFPKTRAKIEATLLVRYGRKQNTEKIRATKLERYGDPTFSNRDKIRRSLLARPDEEVDKWRTSVQQSWAAKTDEEIKKIVHRRWETVLKTHGPDGLKCEKTRETIRKRYGVDNISQTDGWRSKMKETWANKSDNDRKMSDDKRRRTCIKRYGTPYPPASQEGLHKTADMMRKSGKWMPADRITAFKKYKMQVYSLTHRTRTVAFSSDELKRVGRCGDGDALQVDHIFPVKLGFLMGVDVKMIAHPANLCLVHWRE